MLQPLFPLRINRKHILGCGNEQLVPFLPFFLVDGKTYECLKSFCYMGDTIDGDGGADLADTARIRNGWMKFRELLPFLTSSCVRSSMTYGSETRSLLVDVGVEV